MILLPLSIIAAVLVFWSGFAIGYNWQKMTNNVLDFIDTFTTKLATVEPKPQPKPAATIIDPNDPVQRAKYERDQMMSQLNAPEIKE